MASALKTWGMPFQALFGMTSRISYDPRVTKGSAIRDPVLRYLHRLITATISGRRESTGVVTQRDLFYLHCFRTRRIPHLGYGFALYMDTMAKKKKGALCGAPYITRLARGLGVFNSLRGLIKAPPMMLFDMRIIRSLGFVTKRDGQYVIAGQPPVGLPPQVVAPVPPPMFLSGPSFAPFAPGSSSAPPPAPEPLFLAPSPLPADPADFHLTLEEIQHIQRYQGAQLSWLIQGFQHLCGAQGISLPPPPELHNFDAGDDSSGDGTEPLDDDAEDVDITSTDPAEDS